MFLLLNLNFHILLYVTQNYFSLYTIKTSAAYFSKTPNMILSHYYRYEIFHLQTYCHYDPLFYNALFIPYIQTNPLYPRHLSECIKHWSGFSLPLIIALHYVKPWNQSLGLFQCTPLRFFKNCKYSKHYSLTI